MRVIVTGANGFVGRQVCAKLLERGDDVVAVDFDAPDQTNGAQWVLGDISDGSVQDRALKDGCDGIVHLATVPGGAAEADPAASRRVNIDAMYDLLERVAALPGTPRFVFASSIAVLGDPLPADGVNDETPISPELIYGGHKAMMELAVAMFSNRGLIDGVSVRLPGILARPKAPSGMKSAFMSDLFHALKAKEPFVCPTSREATIWAQSLEKCSENLLHALLLDTANLPRNKTVTLPAQRIAMGELAEEVATQCSVAAGLVTWQPNVDIERTFGSYPSLSTHAAFNANFTNDGSTASLVSSALKTLEQ